MVIKLSKICITRKSGRIENLKVNLSFLRISSTLYQEFNKNI
ncbi:hypothetical protein Anas_12751 [Armadillidium nasatum]|uniref:Uncharacterized protein n=1 Tax=Armadillidium nasatum TaxID=96803 RepID=A0A5N5T6H9_9CRUS|nr:hypothetical protein Anas_12751 [Armadillidium nasatum]